MDSSPRTLDVDSLPDFACLWIRSQGPYRQNQYRLSALLPESETIYPRDPQGPDPFGNQTTE